MLRNAFALKIHEGRFVVTSNRKSYAITFDYVINWSKKLSVNDLGDDFGQVMKKTRVSKEYHWLYISSTMLQENYSGHIKP